MKATTTKKIELLLKKAEAMIYKINYDSKTAEEKRQLEHFFSYERLREEKVKKMGLPAYCQLHELFEEEYEYQKEKLKQFTPQQWYQLKKGQWDFHKPSWLMRGLTKDDCKDCNRNGCVRQCRFYKKRGKLTEEEIKNAIRIVTLEEYANLLGKEVVDSIMGVEVEEYTF